MKNEPTRAAIIGMGGFARTHHRCVLDLENTGEARLAATCDPALERFDVNEPIYDFARRGTATFHDYREMLAAVGEKLDVVHVPTPIHLHAEMHAACVERGIPCFLEKPPTLDPAEMDRMLACEAGARRPTQVGFHMVAESARRRLRERMVAGEFGAVRDVRVLVLWPRSDAYYARADWAGRLLRDGRLLLDSCIGNAASHFLHNALLWCGAGAPLAWAAPARVAAELYRGRAEIEGPDAVFAAATTDSGISLRLAVAHACAPADHRQMETVECERARIVYRNPQNVVIEWRDGRREVVADLSLREQPHTEGIRAYYRHLRGEAERPLTRLIESKPFVDLHALIYVAAGRIAPVPKAQTRRAPLKNDPKDLVCAVDGLSEIAERICATGEFPSAQGVAWAQPGGSAGPADMPRLAATVARMAEERKT